MQVIQARNVQHALPLGIQLLQQQGIRRTSRNGAAVEHPEAVATDYLHPTERVLFWPQRDANPYFHFFECLHMLAGREDVAWLAQFNMRIAQYSDDGYVFHGAYGARWRRAFGFDQLPMIIDELRAAPDSRRAVLQMWSATLDLGATSKDLPCNTQVYFKVRDGKLLMTVCCRSNDIVWGAYGANAVHFSFLQEYLADKIGVAVGLYTQISDSFHAYDGVWEKLHDLPVDAPCPYQLGLVYPLPLDARDPQWDRDLQHFLHDGVDVRHCVTPFFRSVAIPLRKSYRQYQLGNFEEALQWARECRATDWQRAATEWLQRRPSYLRRKSP